MGTVVSSFSMPLDGFIADPDDNVSPLLNWYFDGDVEVRQTGHPMETVEGSGVTHPRYGVTYS
jgi:hypothetical protein